MSRGYGVETQSDHRPVQIVLAFVLGMALGFGLTAFVSEPLPSHVNTDISVNECVHHGGIPIFSMVDATVMARCQFKEDR